MDIKIVIVSNIVVLATLVGVDVIYSKFVKKTDLKEKEVLKEILRELDIRRTIGKN